MMMHDGIDQLEQAEAVRRSHGLRNLWAELSYRKKKSDVDSVSEWDESSDPLSNARSIPQNTLRFGLKFFLLFGERRAI